MAATEKFLFETDFDADQAHAREPAAAASPTPQAPAEAEAAAFTQADLDAARAEGHQAGREEGLEAGRNDAAAAADRALAEALETLGTELSTLRGALEAAGEQRSREAAEVALKLVGKLFPALARRHGLNEAEAVVVDALERMREEPRVVVRAGDALVEKLRQRVDGIAERCGFSGKVVLLGDDALGDGDVRVEWADGGAERDTARLWQEVEAALRHAFEGEGAAPPAHADTPAPDTPATDTPATDAPAQADAAPPGAGEDQAAAPAEPARGIA